MVDRKGPLTGYKVLEISGIGPAPFGDMMLADMGAEVLRIERAGQPPNIPPIDPKLNVLHRGRRQLTLNLKDPAHLETLLKLVEKADVVTEGFRPGVAERLGIGPDECLKRNPKLVYARMTGWGQDGPMAQKAGHDINYFALSGSLYMCGRADEVPSPNLNLVADMGGGGMVMAFGIVCALLEAQKSGQGQVIDAAMVDGAAILAAMIYGHRAMGRWKDERSSNLLDSGAPFYDVYETRDGRHFAVGAIEGQFYRDLIKGMGLDIEQLPQHDRAGWPAMRELFKQTFKTRTMDEWTEAFEGLDACATAVLTPDEAANHPHAKARQAFGTPGGVVQPMPAPRFSRTPGAITVLPPHEDKSGHEAMKDWGLTDADVSAVGG